MKNRALLATIFIAACAISTGAAAQNVYKCGSNYSQTPCPDAVTIDSEDARSRAQKTASDKAIARDVASAKAIEKTRLKDEQQADKQGQSAMSDGKATKPIEKKKASKKKGPEFFTAITPISK